MDSPLELIISVFSTPDQARQALKQAQAATKDGAFEIKNAAVIVKDAKGHVHTDDKQDVGTGEGAVFGAVVGGLIGLLAGPGGVVAGAVAGAATGGVSASLMDMGFSQDQLKELEASLPVNSSALVVLVDHVWVEKLMSQLDAAEGRNFRHTLALPPTTTAR